MAGPSKKKSPIRRAGQTDRKDTRSKGRSRQVGASGLTAQLIDLLNLFEGPADAVISRFFKDHAELGLRDRGILAEAAYCWLRLRARINHLAESGEGGSILLRQAKLALLWSGAPETVWAAGRREDNDWLSRVINVPVDNLPLEPRLCLPEWIYQRVVNDFDQDTAEAFAQAVMQAAPLDLRVNTLLAKQDEVIAGLAEQGIEVHPIEGLPDGLRAVGKPVVGRTEMFKKGLFEVQDAGSQWVSKLVAPRRGDLVIDFCAGAGGKTLAIAAAMKNTGRIVALDTSERRLLKFKPRAARAGLSNFYTMAIHDEADPRLNTYFGKADRVVVDVPCSGLGTLKRNPDLKFRQSEQSLAELVQKQQSILNQASLLVKPDGRLIYITCSVLREENEGIIENFLVNNPSFRLRRWTEVLNPDQRPASAELQADCFRLWPQGGESDGFFAAVLQKSKT